MESSHLDPYNVQAMPTPQKEQPFLGQALLSPPESKKNDIFDSPVSIAMSRTPSVSSSSMAGPRFMTQTTQSALMSPPISPYTSQRQEMDKDDGNTVRDPPLFSRTDSAAANDVVLFPENRHLVTQQDTEAAIAERVAENARQEKLNVPTAEEYAIICEAATNRPFVSVVNREYNKNPQAWLGRERRLWDAYENLCPSTKKPTSNRKTLISPSYRRLAPAPSGGVRNARASLTRIRIGRKPKVSPSQNAYDEFTGQGPASLTPPTAVQPNKITSRDDLDFEALADYSPSIVTLGNNSKAFKMEWKGGPGKPLGDDPNRHLLHEAELNLASVLRLSCGTYLCCKRRIFISRREALKKGKAFRKTDAQQACKIDVNKASKLWTAFDKVGWFRGD